MEKIVEQGLLYDFYGSLLTDHQKQVYEAAVYEDMSLREIAEEFQITYQGVHDLLKRCDKILLGYESKLHLLEKYSKEKKLVSGILEEAKAGREKNDPKAFDRIKELAEGLLKEL